MGKLLNIVTQPVELSKMVAIAWPSGRLVEFGRTSKRPLEEVDAVYVSRS